MTMQSVQLNNNVLASNTLFTLEPSDRAMYVVDSDLDGQIGSNFSRVGNGNLEENLSGPAGL